MHTRTHTTIIDVNYEYGLQGHPFAWEQVFIGATKTHVMIIEINE